MGFVVVSTLDRFCTTGIASSFLETFSSQSILLGSGFGTSFMFVKSSLVKILLGRKLEPDRFKFTVSSGYLKSTILFQCKQLLPKIRIYKLPLSYWFVYKSFPN